MKVELTIKYNARQSACVKLNIGQIFFAFLAITPKSRPQSELVWVPLDAVDSVES